MRLPTSTGTVSLVNQFQLNQFSNEVSKLCPNKTNEEGSPPLLGDRLVSGWLAIGLRVAGSGSEARELSTLGCPTAVAPALPRHPS